MIMPITFMFLFIKFSHTFYLIIPTITLGTAITIFIPQIISKSHIITKLPYALQNTTIYGKDRFVINFFCLLEINLPLSDQFCFTFNNRNTLLIVQFFQKLIKPLIVRLIPSFNQYFSCAVIISLLDLIINPPQIGFRQQR